MKNMSKCDECGYMFPWEDVGDNPRTLCPDCYSTARGHVRTIEDRLYLGDEPTKQPRTISDEPVDEQGG